MPIFYCKMTEPGGRIVEETITADSKAILIKRLKKEGNFVLEIRREEEFGSLKKEISRRRIKANDLLLLSILVKEDTKNTTLNK